MRCAQQALALLVVLANVCMPVESHESVFSAKLLEDSEKKESKEVSFDYRDYEEHRRQCVVRLDFSFFEFLTLAEDPTLGSLAYILQCRAKKTHQNCCIDSFYFSNPPLTYSVV